MFFTITKPVDSKTPTGTKSMDFVKNLFKNSENNVTYESLRDKVRELAYSKWEEAGHPWGKDKEFWIEAEKELFGENPLRDGGYKIKSKSGTSIIICPINSEVPVGV